MKLSLIYRMIARVYDLIDVIYFRNYERSPRRAVLEQIAGHEQILDLCTGTATNAVGIAKNKTDTQVVGVDLSDHMLKVAVNKANKQGIKNVKLYQMDATQLEFQEKSFDKILLSLVLHELDEELAEKMMIEARRVLKDNGKIIITEWEPSKQPVKRLLFLPIHYLEPKSYRKFIEKDLYSYFRQFGLKLERYEHCDYTKVITLVKE